MNKFLFIIQTLIIIVLLVISVTLAMQLNEYQRAYGVLTKGKMAASQIPTMADSQKNQLSPAANTVPDFSTVLNSPTNPPEVEAAIGEISKNNPTGYRVSADKKSIVYMNPDHMVLMTVATKEERELVSFKTWERQQAATPTECVPGSRFAKPIFNGDESAVYFVGPSQGRDAIYLYVMGEKEAKVVTLVDDCVTDIAASPKGLNLAYQTSKTLATATEGYVTDLYIVQAGGGNSEILAKQGKLPQNSLADSSTSYDFAPALIVWTAEDTFYLQGLNTGKPIGVWKYSLSKKAFEAVSNLKGGP